MRMTVTVLLALAIWYPVRGVAQNEKGVADSLDGTWRIESLHEEGREQKDALGWLVTFKAGKLSVKVGDTVKGDGTYKADASKEPKWLDIKTERSSIRAIYEVKGDTLRLCHGRADADERATKFASENGTGNRTLVVLKRVQQ